MRILLTILAATLLTAPLTQRAAAKEVSVEFFYDSLDPYGDWIQTADYGYVWHPKDVQEDWRPYTVGSWAYTDAGWTWVSDEPFGAITYHYGRWTRLQDTGWVWVPDTEWAPAWVSWRRSEENVGWAPLPPEATFKRDVGISSWSDSYYDIGPSQYAFVSVRDFGSPRLSTVILPRRDNVTIITQTRNITNITYTSGGIYNEGPQYVVISRESREPVRRLRLERRDDVAFEGNRVRGEGLKGVIVGDALQVFAPTVGFRADAAPPRVSRKVARVEVDHGWSGVPQAQELRARIQQNTPPAPANLPKQPTFTRATAALGLSDNASRKSNLDADGKPHVSAEGKGAFGTGPAAIPGTGAREEPKPGERPKTATEGGFRKPGTAEMKPGQGRPSTTAEPAPGAPRTVREAVDPAAPGAPRGEKPALPEGPNSASTVREGTKPGPTTRPESATEKPAVKPEGPRGSKEPMREPLNPATRGGTKPAPTLRPESAPEGTRGIKEGRPESSRPNPANPESERGVGKEPKVAAPSGASDPVRPRREGGAPETRRPEGNVPKPESAGVRPGAAAAHPGSTEPATKGEKKGEKDKDKDKEKEKAQ